MRSQLALALVVLATSGLAFAATPPALVNYQGVLRGATDAPLSGTYDVVFRLFDDPNAGSEILVDSHTSGSGGAITVSGGLFNVAIGGGTITDGAGAGTYTSLADVFRDYGAVWLGVQIGSESLTPRTRIQSSAYALNASNLQGRNAASFLDTSSALQTKSGPVRVDASSVSGVSAIEAYSTNTAGTFRNGTPAAPKYEATLGLPDRAGKFTGPAGGFPWAYLAWDDPAQQKHYGVYAKGLDFGVYAAGGVGVYGASEQEIPASVGVMGEGNGPTGIGVKGQSNYIAGTFRNSTFGGAAGVANLGLPLTGVVGYGQYNGCDMCDGGGKFYDVAYDGSVVLADGDTGLLATGGYAAGIFRHTFDIFGDYDNWANVGGATYKITGVGSMAFVQNHPGDSTKVIVYNAPEGDEVATYTRGSARLVRGEARVPLDETFAWTTNPDLGLTAHLTPRGEAVPLAIVALSTHEIVVRAPTGSPDVEFDFLVYGLRIGFETTSIVQEKDTEAFIPPMTFHNEQYQRHPELRQFSADARFHSIEASLGRPKAAKTAAAQTLKDAIGVFDRGQPQDWNGTVLTRASRASFDATRARGEVKPRSGPEPRDSHQPTPALVPPTSAARSGVEAALHPWPPNSSPFPVSEIVEIGDLVALDPGRPGRLRRSETVADPAVVGIVVGDPGTTWTGEAPVAIAGVAVACKVDATDAPIGAGDLLVAGRLAGFAMRAGENPAQGTVIGKALEPLPGGTGTIRVLVMSR